MARQERSAQEIQAEVGRLIHDRRVLREARIRIQVPMPSALPVDGTGLNWWMCGFGNAIGFEQDIREVVTDVGKRWNLVT